MTLYHVERARVKTYKAFHEAEALMAEHGGKCPAVNTNTCPECQFRRGWIEGLRQALVILGARKV